MPPNCDVCDKNIDRRYDDFVSCEECKMSIHLKCADLSNEEWCALKRDNKMWFCSKCALVIQKNDLKKLSVQMKENTDFMKSRFDGLQKSMDLIASLQHEVKILKEENVFLKTKIEFIERKLDLLEPSKSDVFEIHGIPESQGENLNDIVLKMCVDGLKLKEIRSDQIKKVFRAKSSVHKNPTRSSKIVVLCDSQITRDEILKEKRRIKDLNANQFGFQSGSKIMLFESLSYYKKDLLYKANLARSDGKLKFVWVRNGNIMVRKTEGGRVTYLKSLSDLERILSAK